MTLLTSLSTVTTVDRLRSGVDLVEHGDVSITSATPSGNLFISFCVGRLLISTDELHSLYAVLFDERARELLGLPTTTGSVSGRSVKLHRYRDGRYLVGCGAVTLDCHRGDTMFFVGFQFGQLIIDLSEIEALDQLLHDARVRTTLNLT